MAMKAFATFGTAVLFLSLGTFVPAFAQHEQEEAKPEEKQQQEHEQQKQNKQQEKEHAQQQNQDKQQQQEHAQQLNQNKQQQAVQQSQNKPQPQQQQPPRQGVQRSAYHHTPEQQQAQQVAWQGHRSENWESDHRTWQQRGGYTGYRIPDDRFRGYFGPAHGFVIYRQPYMVVSGFPRFRYGGYWFGLVDPWPGYWAQNWYQTDDVYVVCRDNGYYMYNRRYPTVGLAINVTL
jgi:hypothetical protein